MKIILQNVSGQGEVARRQKLEGKILSCDIESVRVGEHVANWHVG